MAAPAVILNSGWILVKETDSSVIGVSGSENITFGDVAAVSDMAERYIVGDHVCLPKGSYIKDTSNLTYYLLKETDVIYKEITPP